MSKYEWISNENINLVYSNEFYIGKNCLKTLSIKRQK